MTPLPEWGGWIRVSDKGKNHNLLAVAAPGTVGDGGEQSRESVYPLAAKVHEQASGVGREANCAGCCTQCIALSRRARAARRFALSRAAPQYAARCKGEKGEGAQNTGAMAQSWRNRD